MGNCELSINHRKKTSRDGTVNPLTGKFFCGDCGEKLYNSRGTNHKGTGHCKEDIRYDNYICSTYQKHRNECSAHYIRTKVVRELILENAKRYADRFGLKVFDSNGKILYEGCYKVLRILCREYEWLKTENNGNKPMIKTKEQLSYYATLMEGWINSKPLKYLIQKTISWYHNSGNSKNIFLSIDGRKYQEKFDRNNDFHINTLINNLINDLENNVKYRIKTYVSNYQSILESTNLGLVCDWAEYIDYGTTDSNIIEIQNLGFSRTIAIFLLDNCSSLFIRNDIGEIIDIDEEELRTNIDKEKY